MSRRFPFIAVLLLVARVASAQLLTGIVRDSASRTPVPGAVVMLLDAGGATLSQTVSNQRGEYRLAHPADARTLRARRIGFRPRTLALPNGVDRVDVAMVLLPTLLSAVTVDDQPGCPRRADRRAAFALWELSRDALLATVVARDANDVHVRRYDLRRVVGESRPNVLAQTVFHDEARTTRPFVSGRSAATLIRDGYQETTSGERALFGPDADVLLDSSFVGAYCLALAGADRARPTQLGLAFAPKRGRAKHVDIAGTLWVDTAARALDAIEYQYVDVAPSEAAFDIGGRVHFATMPNGAPAIDRWSLRLANDRYAREPNGRAPGDALELIEVGGGIERAEWSDAAPFRAALGTVRGRLVHEGGPVPAQRVVLAGTDYEATTDSSGAFEIGALVPGRYAFAIPDSALNEIGMELTRGQTFEAFADSIVRVGDVMMPTYDDVIAARCGPDATSAQIGRVFGIDGMVSYDATVSLALRSEPTGQLVGLRGFTTHVGLGTHFHSVFDGMLGGGGTFAFCRGASTDQLAVLASDPPEKTTVIGPRIPRRLTIFNVQFKR